MHYFSNILILSGKIPSEKGSSFEFTTVLQGCCSAPAQSFCSTVNCIHAIARIMFITRGDADPTGKPHLRTQMFR